MMRMSMADRALRSLRVQSDWITAERLGDVLSLTHGERDCLSTTLRRLTRAGLVEHRKLPRVHHEYARRGFRRAMGEEMSKSLDDLVMTAIGEASVCWESVNDAGVFDSVRAADIGEALLRELRDRERNTPTLDKLPAFPCGFAVPFKFFGQVAWQREGESIDDAFQMSPDEARGIARRFVELADEIDAERAQKERG